MAPADSWAAVRGPHDPLSPKSGTRPRPPGVSTTAFTAHLLGFTALALDGYGLHGHWPTRPASPASYPVSVRQVTALLHASFRSRLTTTPWRAAPPFTSIRLGRGLSPPSCCACPAHCERRDALRFPALVYGLRAQGGTHGSPPTKIGRSSDSQAWLGNPIPVAKLSLASHAFPSTTWERE